MEGNENWKCLWVQKSVPSFISDITKVNEEAQLPMYEFTDKFKMSKGNYFANHCEHCNALQGDFYLHEKPGEAFCPTNLKEVKNIKLFKIDQPFYGSGSHGWDNDFDFIKLCLQHPKKRGFFAMIKSFK
jgi:hypothetical protein